MRKITSLFSVLMLLCALAYGQNRVVTGKVTDDKGNPLPYASITETGTNRGTTANINGIFTITISQKGRLTISAAGYQPRTASPNGNILNLSLSPGDVSMQEVVVTSAGGIRVRQKEQGYTSTLIKADVLTATRPVNIASGLQGKVAGLLVSGSSSGVNPNYRLILRGMRSLTGNNEALIVLDNVIVPNALLGNLNPQDIAEVVVLNGSSAAALYGSDASNGALIITTKKGSKGRTSINVAQTIAREEVAFYPKLQKQFGSGSNNDVQIYLPYENQQFGPAFDGSIKEIGQVLADGSIQRVPYSATDEKEKFWNKGYTYQTDVSASGGGERSTVYFSGQYARAMGTTPGDKYNRASVGLKGNFEFLKNLMLTYSTTYTQNRYNITSQTAAIYDRLLNTPAQIPLTTYTDWKNDPFANPNGYYNEFYANPYFLADNYRQLTRNDYFTGSADLKYSPKSWLDVLYRIGATTRNQSYKNTSDKFTYSSYAMAHAQGTIKKQNVVGGVTDGSTYTTRLNSEFQILARKKVQDFDLKFLVGGSVRHDESKELEALISGLVIPGLFNLNNSTTPPTATEANYKANQFGLYGKINIGYNNNAYNLEITGRRDWVSTLAPENRSFFYPSVTGNIVLTDAIPALKNREMLNLLKIRGGLSKVGQVNLGSNYGAYRLAPTFTQSSGYPFNGQGGFSVGNQIVSADLKPEITKGYEVGLDIIFWKEKISTNLTYYSNKTSNQTVSTGVSSATGFSSYLVNTGLTSGKGLEATMEFTPFRTKNWMVTFRGTYAYNDNKVESISADLPRLSITGGSGLGSYAVAGQPFPMLMGTRHKRDSLGRIIVNPITGYPSATDTIALLGNAAPKHVLGLSFDVSYKGIHLHAQAEYRSGYVIYNGGGTTLDFSGASYLSAAFNRDRFVIPNSSYEDPNKKGTYIANTNITVRDGGPGYWTIAGPRTGINENYVTAADFWKIRELTLSYDIPSRFLGRTKAVKQASITLLARNLFIFLPPSNVYTDPEYSANGSTSNAIGLTSLGQTPPSRYYGATISLTF